MIRVEPLRPCLLEDLGRKLPRYDAIVGALGYELRSSQIPMALRRHSDRGYLLDLHSPGEGSYDRNREMATASDWEIVLLEDSRVSSRATTRNSPAAFLPSDHSSLASRTRDWMHQLVQELIEQGVDRPVLAVDVSSFTRHRIAGIVEALAELHRTKPRHGSVIVDFLYTPAKWDQRGGESRLTEVLGPVTPLFAGAPSDLSLPVVAFVGLGSERDRAIGALEYLEAGDIWAFAPTGEDPHYDSDMHAANSWLLDHVLHQDRVMEYAVDDPFGCYIDLEQLVFSELAHARVILVPLGPKIFATCCLLVAANHRKRVGVWRVSPGRYGEPVSRESAGKVVAMRAEFLG